MSEKLDRLFSRRLPNRIVDDVAFNELVHLGVVGTLAPEAPILNARTPLTTVGSCFAQNIAKYLARLNYDILRLNISDRLFSPVALRYFFENLSEDASVYQRHWTIEQSTIDALRTRLSQGGVVVVTFGMSAVWVKSDTGEYVFDPTRKNGSSLARPNSGYEMMQTSVDENIDAISGVVNAIKALNRTNRVILTLSPLPLIYAKHMPVVVADCMSKATLRVALDEVLRAGLKGVHYFPSFELLKWLAPMTDMIWYADDTLAHIRSDWIAYTMGVFSEYYCADKLPKILPVETFAGSETSPPNGGSGDGAHK